MKLEPRFLEHAGRWGERMAHRFAEGWCGRCESPIELEFLIAYCLWNFVPPHRFPVIVVNGGIPPEWQSATIGHFVAPQAQLGKYRVDFLIKNRLAWAIVECDGRAYHHDSWAQIERDRERDVALQALAPADTKLFRFPEAEIRRDPFECVTLVDEFFEEENAVDDDDENDESEPTREADYDDGAPFDDGAAP